MMRIHSGFLLSLCALPLTVACASTTPSVELRNARAEMTKAERGLAPQLAPAELHDARTALQRAEAASRADADSPRARDQAYIAWRRTQLAEAKAEILHAQQQQADAGKRMHELEQQRAAITQNRLTQTEQSLAERQSALQAEQQARTTAEQKTRETEAKLAKLAEVRHDERGTVVTLSGSVLFAFGKSELLPTAKARLDEVAAALLESEQSIVIEGYTDAKGSDAKNQLLSQARAESVRAYLVGKGVAADQIVAVGRGESNPVADNASPEGRANNRRVEIVLKPVSQPAGPGTPSTPGDKKVEKKDKKPMDKDKSDKKDKFGDEDRLD